MNFFNSDFIPYHNFPEMSNTDNCPTFVRTKCRTIVREKKCPTFYNANWDISGVVKGVEISPNTRHFPRLSVMPSPRSSFSRVARTCSKSVGEPISVPSSRYHKFRDRPNASRRVTTRCKATANSRGLQTSPCCTPHSAVSRKPGPKRWFGEP